jgi:hypothetical protein
MPPNRQHRCLIRKNKVFQISPRNEALVIFHQGLFHFKGISSGSPSIPLRAEYIPNLCSILDIVARKKEQKEEFWYVVAACVGNKTIWIKVKNSNVTLVESTTHHRYGTDVDYEIQFDFVNVKMLKDLYLKCKLPED